MSESYSIPKGWALPCIGDVAILLAGYGFPTEYQGQSEGDLPFFKVGDISEAWQRNDRKLTKAKHYLTFDEAANLRAKPLPAGSVVFAKIGAAISLNRRAILSQPSLIDNNCMGLAAQSELLDHTYLFYFTCTLRLGESSRASVVPSLRKSDVEPISFPLPPLAEQSRIVAKIEELFSDLDAGVAALKRAKANLKRYRASVLKAAVEGKLTEQWRAKHPAKEPASALLARILKERRLKWEADQLAKFAAAKKQPPKNWRDKYVEPLPPDLNGLPDLPKGWCWVTWEHLLFPEDGAFKRGPFGSALTKSMFVSKGYKVYEQYCPINDDCSFARYYITDVKFREMESFAVRAGDYLISCSGVTLGRITQVPEEFEQGIINQALLRVRIDCGVMRQNYFLRFFRSPLFQQQIFENSTGSAIPNVKGVKELKALRIPLPPLAEQEVLAFEIDETLSQIAAAETQIEHGLLRAARLRQSILKRAFEGKLVPQDPKDESASALLERLRTSRTHDEANGTAATSKRTRAKIKESSGEPRTRIRRRPSSQN
jgi:type I restriction enzyme, S subunit